MTLCECVCVCVSIGLSECVWDGVCPSLFILCASYVALKTRFKSFFMGPIRFQIK